MEARKILVVEDDSRMRGIVSWSLRNRGHAVVEAGYVEAALAEIANDPPDCIVLDGMLPDRTGFELCVDLKGNPVTRDIPVLLLSGITQGVPGTGLSLRNKTRADAYLPKPCRLAQVIDTVEHLMASPAERRTQ